MVKTQRSSSTDHTWEDYPRDRVYRRHPSGFLIIKPKEEVQTVPIDCPICSFLMSNFDDVVAFRNFKCCDRCRIAWADGFLREIRWKEGWRPSPEEIQEEIYKRGWSSSEG